MTMNFRDIKASLIDLLGAAALDRFRVIGYQEQAQGANEVLNTNRSIQVYYALGSFPKSGGSINGPVVHDITFRIDLTVSKSSLGDLATLENPSATAEQKAVALAGFQEAVKLADDSLDELFDVVYQIVMDARNIDLDMGFLVANRWCDNFKKDAPINYGQFVVLTGSFDLTCRIDEQLDGDPGVEAGNIMDVSLTNGEDEVVLNAGVLTGSESEV